MRKPTKAQRDATAYERIDELADLVRGLSYALYVTRYAVAYLAIEGKDPADPTGRPWADWLEGIAVLREKVRKVLA